MQTTSPSLLKRLRKPNQADAWSRFVRLYSPLLYAWVCRMGLQQADADDLVQDVFATLLEKLPEFEYDNHKRFRGWLWTVTKNKWRERLRAPALPIDRRRKGKNLSAPAEADFEEKDFRQYLLTELIPTYQDQFQPSTWQAFWEHVIEGKPAVEVAKRLGVGKSAISMAKVRVLARLHKELGDLFD